MLLHQEIMRLKSTILLSILGMMPRLMNMAVTMRMDLVVQLSIHGKEAIKVPADHFFANFNWTRERKNDYSVTMAKWLGRSQYDVFAGLELQQGGSTDKSEMGCLLMKMAKLRLSLGLFAPDTITSLGKTGERLCKNEISSLQLPKESNWSKTR